MDSTCNNQLVPCYGPMNYNGAEEERKEEEELPHNTGHDDELNKDQVLHSPNSVINPKFDPYAYNTTTNMEFQEEQKSPQQQETGGAEAVTSSWFWLPENSKENDVPKENQVPLSPKLVMDDSDGIPLDVISSQERAWKELHNNTPGGGGGSKVTRKPVEIRKSSNPTGSDSIHPRKMAMKEERQMVTAAGVASGALIGGIVAGPAFPLGAILGGAYAGYAANKLHKHGERKAQRRWEKYTFQKGVMDSPINQSDGCVFV